jgi:D-sedoheptulose 7-phosphate isomerase
MKIKDFVRKHLEESIKVETLVIDNCLDSVKEVAIAVFETYYKKGGAVFLFGNGGSASCAEHIAEELLNRLKNYRIPISAYALTSQPAILTGIANDFGFEKVFSRQLEALATPKDLVVGLSTSGNSPNVLEGIRLAKLRNIKTTGMTGKNGGKLAKMVDIAIQVPTNDVSLIQEAHTSIGHIICSVVEEMLFGERGFEE